MGDPTHIIVLIAQLLDETADRPGLQQKIGDLRDVLLQAQQEAHQYSLKIKTLEEAIRKLKSPAHRIGTVLGPGLDGLCRLSVGGQEYQAAVSPEIKDSLNVGDQVALNEGFTAIAKLPPPTQGAVARLSTRLDDGQWMVSIGAGGAGNAESMAALRHGLELGSLKEGDEVILDPSQKIIMDKLPQRQAKTAVEDDFVSAEWSQIGGQEKVIEQVRKVIEYPLLHAEILEKMEYQQPKGFLFYGPPGCGKTMVGRAILTDIIKKLGGRENKNMQGKFIHVKGPEILNMWLGESERKIREIFKKAREYREKDHIPFIFIDEAESILGIRQAWRGSNITSTLVPMFCAEMDGIQSLRETVVILATNRPDLIDPAILRPGRIDRKIKVGRPGREGCGDIMKIYLKENLPREHDDIEKMIDPFLEKLFAKTNRQKVLTLTLKTGELKSLYWKDFVSGAIIEGIVKRAKEKAIERAIVGGELTIKVDDLLSSLEAEFVEDGQLPSAPDMEDWLQLLDVDPQNVARVRRPQDSDGAAASTLNRSMI